MTPQGTAPAGSRPPGHAGAGPRCPTRRCLACCSGAAGGRAAGRLPQGCDSLGVRRNRSLCPGRLLFTRINAAERAHRRARTHTAHPATPGKGHICLHKPLPQLPSQAGRKEGTAANYWGEREPGLHPLPRPLGRRHATSSLRGGA